MVPAQTTIEFVPLRVFRLLVPTVKVIVAIPAIEDILSLGSEYIVLAVAPVEHVITLPADQEVPVPRPAVDDVAAVISAVLV